MKQAQLTKTRARIKEDPVWFCEQVLGVSLWEKEREILLSLRDNHHTAVPACHSSSKTHAAACGLLWFVSVHNPGRAVSTAPTERQVKAVLWQQLAQLHRAAKVPLGGTMLTTAWDLEPGWRADGMVASEYDPEKMSGVHERHILVVVDECSGVSRMIGDQLDGLVSGGEVARRIDLGNPVRVGYFQELCNDSYVNTIQIDAFETPNFTAFGLIPEDFDGDRWEEKVKGPAPRPYLIQPAYAATIARRYGLESNIWTQRVRGRFSKVAEGAYFEREMERADEQSRIGVVPYDPALPVHTAWDLGLGKDSNAMFIWFFQSDGTSRRYIDCYANHGRSLAHYCGVLRAKDYVYGKHFAPPDIKSRELSAGEDRALTRLEVAKSHGIDFTPIPDPSIADRIEASRNNLARSWFDAEACDSGLMGLRNYVEARDHNGEAKGVPEKNWASHPADAYGISSLAVTTMQSGYDWENAPLGVVHGREELPASREEHYERLRNRDRMSVDDLRGIE